MAEGVLSSASFESVLALRQLMLSAWRVDAMTSLDFDADTKRRLDRIAAETEEDVEAMRQAFDAWREGARVDARKLETFEGEELHAARQGYLEALTAANEAAAIVFQKASLLAPEPLSDEFARLGGRCFDHAMRLRKLHVDLFYTESPFPDIREGDAAPPGRST